MTLHQPESNLTRRHLLQASALAGPLLLAASGKTRAQESGSPAGPLQHPTSRYPQPPFDKQPKLDWPGLTSQMNPRPDHGEESYQGSGRLAGRKALITGGDSGIGRAVAIAFAREGADVAIGHLPAEAADAAEVVKLIEAAGRKAVSLPGDIKDEAFCQQLVADAASQLGGLDILVNNAAYQMVQPALKDLTTDQFDAVFKTNVYAMFWITKAALAHLPAGAAIINTASIQAYDPSPGLVDYAQTKACVVSFTKSLAKQLAEQGIRVNAVAPGPIWTPLIPATMPQQQFRGFGGDTPLKRPGQPAELAPTYVLLASAEASYVTGEVFGNVGGQSPY